MKIKNVTIAVGGTYEKPDYEAFYITKGEPQKAGSITLNFGTNPDGK